MPTITTTDGASINVIEPSTASGVSRRVQAARESGENAKVKDADGDVNYVNPQNVVTIY